MKTLGVGFLSIFLLGMVFTPVVAKETEGKEIMEASEESDEVEKVDSFDMFWPIVAGKSRGNSLYFLKSFKEKLRGFLIFSDFKKAEYKIMLADKRTVEAEKLLMVDKDFDNGKKTLEDGKKDRQMAVSRLEKATASGIDTTGLKDKILSSFEKEQKLLKSMKLTVSDEGKSMIDESVSDIETLTSSVR